MEIQVEQTGIRDLVVLRHKVAPDDRGFFMEVFKRDVYEAAGLPVDYPQINLSRSLRGVVRGLHFQWDPPMGKLVRCISGSVLDVLVDVRHGSPTLADHVAVELSGRNHKVIWGPPGFAHGTIALEDDAIVLYECTAEHGPGGEGGIRWNDPALGIAWPDIPAMVSEKDRQAPTLAEWLADPRSRHFRY